MKSFYTNLGLALAFLSIAACSRPQSSEVAIVRGHTITDDSPAKYSAVKVSTAQGGCTGTIIAPHLVLTAAHCVDDVTEKQILVTFESIAAISSDHTRTVKSKKTFKPEGSQFFPNFDVAYLELDSDVPAPFHPIEILRDPAALTKDMDILLSGFGTEFTACRSENCSGKLLETITGFQRYYDEAHIMSLMVFYGDPALGRGTACHGDSGGPAYVKLKDVWYLIGVTNGTSKTLTPESDLSCESGWDIYTFAGDYVPWLEKTSGTTLNQKETASNPPRALPPRVVMGPSEIHRPTTWAEWVDYANHEDSAWYTVNFLLQKFALTKVFSGTKSGVTELLYQSDLSEPLVTATTSLQFSGPNIGNLDPLESFSGLQSLEINGTKVGDLRGVSSLPELKDLSLTNMTTTQMRSTLSSMGASRGLIENLKLSQVFLDDLNAADWSHFTHLETLKIASSYGTLPLEGLSGLPVKNLTTISLERMNAKGNLSLNGYQGSLKLSDIAMQDQSSPNWSSLKDLTSIDFGGLSVPSDLDMKGFAKLRTLILKNGNIASLKGLSLPATLEVLDLSGNRLPDLTSVPAALNKLKAYDNPLVDKTCPAKSCELDLYPVPASLEQYCLNANNALKNGYSPSYAYTLIALQNKVSQFGQPGSLECSSLALRTGMAVSLDLSDLLLDDIRPFRFLGSNLTTLTLKNNLITDLSPIRGMSKLKTLDVSGNLITKLDLLWTLPQLETLVAGNNPLMQISVENPKLLSLSLIPGVASPDTYLPISFATGSLMKDLTASNLQQDDLERISHLEELTKLTLLGKTTLDLLPLKEHLGMKVSLNHPRLNEGPCPLIAGNCSWMTEGSFQTELGPLLGTVSGKRLESNMRRFNLPGIKRTIELPSTP